MLGCCHSESTLLNYLFPYFLFSLFLFLSTQEKCTGDNYNSKSDWLQQFLSTAGLARKCPTPLLQFVYTTTQEYKTTHTLKNNMQQMVLLASLFILLSQAVFSTLVKAPLFTHKWTVGLLSCDVKISPPFLSEDAPVGTFLVDRGIIAS